MSYIVQRGADGAVKSIGPNVEGYHPLLDDGDTIEYADTIPEIPVVVDYKAEAQAALDRSDLVALRCFKAGVAFPPEWVDYCEALREVVNTGLNQLPAQPAYPEGS